MSRTYRPLLAVLALAAGFLGGCDDESTCPPGEDSPRPSFENIWPSADSTAWTYAVTERTAWMPDTTTLYPRADVVPPAPGRDEVIRRLGILGVGDSAEVTEGIYRLRFDGMVTTASGVRTQKLEERLYSLDWVDPPPKQMRSDPFLERLAMHRPDLRDEIASLDPGETHDDFERLPHKPLFLHGGAWTRTTDWIGTFGDVDTLLAWKFLGRDLRPGAEFIHQLVPALADDIFLHGWVVRECSVRTDAGVFENCLECVYMVDYGLFSVEDDTGVQRGWYRSVDIGSIVYAPGIGPIRSEERLSLPWLWPEHRQAAAITIGLTGYRRGHPGTESW
jgi:hypothetical protein